MRNAFRAFAVLLPAFVFSASTARAVEVDGVAATVGEESILRSDVYGEMHRTGVTDEAAFASVLDGLIDRKLILRAARSAKVTMQEWVVENRVREIVQRAFGGDRNRLVAALAQQKLSYPEWYAKTKEDLVIGAMRWNVVDKNVTASPKAMREEYEAHRDRYVRDHVVSVAVIVLKPDERERRDEISAALKEKTFEELGGSRYEDVKPEEMFRPAVAEAIAGMPTGAVSDWIELDGWSFLLRKDGERTGEALSFDDAYEQVEAAVKEADAKRLYTGWLARLRAETYVKVF